MRTFILGYDDSEPSTRALDRVIELAKAFDGFVVVVSVARALMPAGRGIGPVDPTDPPELHREQVSRAKAKLDELGIGGAYEVGLGEPADLIVKVADERDADMIVVGTSEPGLIARLLGQSVSETVQRRAHCDVLIVH